MNSIGKMLTILLCVSAFGLSAFASETVKGAKKDIEAFKKEMAVKLEETEKKLAELRNKAGKKGDQMQTNAVKELETTRDTLKAELNDAKSDAHTNWSKFKVKMAKSIDELNEKIQKKLKD